MEHYKFFTNKDCEYYPCHKIPDNGTFNCLFCYCPLNKFDDCGGNFELLSDLNGGFFKDCSNCNFPHDVDNYDEIICRLWR